MVEEELTSFKEVMEKHPNIPQGDLFRMVLVCKNCNHKDLLVKFIKKKEMDWARKHPLEKPYPDYPKPNPWKQPKPYQPKPYYKWINKTQPKDKIMMMALFLNHEEYEEFFYCPKCGSSLVALSSEFSKENIAKVL